MSEVVWNAPWKCQPPPGERGEIWEKWLSVGADILGYQSMSKKKL